METDEELKEDEEGGRGRNRAGEGRGNKKVVDRGGRERGRRARFQVGWLQSPILSHLPVQPTLESSTRDLSVLISHIHLLSLQSTFCAAVPENFLCATPCLPLVLAVRRDN